LPCVSAAVSEAQLRAADEIWLAFSTRGVLPVTRLDGVPVGTGRPGPLFARLHAAFHAYIERARRHERVMSRKTLLKFPVEFPIKVMGRHDSDLRAQTPGHRRAARRGARRGAHTQRGSSDGNFVAITYLVIAHSREQLDQIYTELTACKSVLMAL
jgi:putative lipoic acid-binding regulatory protein